MTSHQHATLMGYVQDAHRNGEFDKVQGAMLALELLTGRQSADNMVKQTTIRRTRKRYDVWANGKIVERITLCQ